MVCAKFILSAWWRHNAIWCHNHLKYWKLSISAAYLDKLALSTFDEGLLLRNIMDEHHAWLFWYDHQLFWLYHNALCFSIRSKCRKISNFMLFLFKTAILTKDYGLIWSTNIVNGVFEIYIKCLITSFVTKYRAGRLMRTLFSADAICSATDSLLQGLGLLLQWIFCFALDDWLRLNGLSCHNPLKYWNKQHFLLKMAI